MMIGLIILSLLIGNDRCSTIKIRIFRFRTNPGQRCNSCVIFSSVPSTLKVILLDVGVGLLADHLLLLVGGGQEAADSAALSAGVGHELGIMDTLAQPGPVLTPGVLVHTSLKQGCVQQD